MPIGQRSTSGGRGVSPGATQGRPERAGIDFYGQGADEEEALERKRQENLRQQIAIKER